MPSANREGAGLQTRPPPVDHRDRRSIDARSSHDQVPRTTAHGNLVCGLDPAQPSSIPFREFNEDSLLHEIWRHDYGTHLGAD